MCSVTVPTPVFKSIVQQYELDESFPDITNFKIEFEGSARLSCIHCALYPASFLLMTSMKGFDFHDDFSVDAFDDNVDDANDGDEGSISKGNEAEQLSLL